MKVYIRNSQRRIKVSQQRIGRLLRKTLRLLGLREAELSVLLVNDRRMRVLNRQYRCIDRTTDVLSFPQLMESQISGPGPQVCLLGDIVINLHRAERQAKEYGLSLNQELKRLLVHGLLHLAGYDHEGGGYGEREMAAKSRYLLARLGKD